METVPKIWPLCSIPYPFSFTVPGRRKAMLAEVDFKRNRASKSSAWPEVKLRFCPYCSNIDTHVRPEFFSHSPLCVSIVMTNEQVEALIWPIAISCVVIHRRKMRQYNYLCTYDLYSPVHNVLDACICITRASGRGLGPGIREFFGPCEMASSRAI